MARVFNPQRLDVHAFAAAAAELQGELAPRDLPRLTASVTPLPGDGVPVPVSWAAVGEQRGAPGGARATWLHLTAATSVTLQCQRCLQPLIEPLAIDRWFRFVNSEEEAARLDEEVEEDVLVGSPRFELRELLEDELILALPIVPRHGECPQPLALAAAEVPIEPTHPNPFAALAALRRPPPGN